MLLSALRGTVRGTRPRPSRYTRFSVVTVVNPCRTVAHALRDYQQQCIEASLQAFAAGRRRIAVSLPVGSGKTTVFANLIPKIPSPRPEATRTLVLAHRVELLTQAVQRIKAYNPHLSVAIDQGKQRAKDTDDVVVASVPTLGRLGSSRLLHLDPREFKAIIIDEAHHAVASTYIRILQHFEALDASPTGGITSTSIPSEPEPAPFPPPLDQLQAPLQRESHSPNHHHQHPHAHRHHSRHQPHIHDSHQSARNSTTSQGPVVWGCSATVRRHDARALGDIFEDIVFHIPLLEMMQRGHLCPLRAKRVVSPISLASVAMSSVTGDFQPAALSRRVAVEARNRVILEAYKTYCADRKATLVFAVDINHVNQLEAAFTDAGVLCKSITSETHPTYRQQVLDEFMAGQLPVLVNCAILTEGTDLPCIDSIIMARPTCSEPLFQQMIGRGLRRHPSKQDCLCLDIVDSFSKNSIVTTPTLLGLSCSFDFDGQRTEEVQAALDQALMGDAQKLSPDARQQFLQSATSPSTLGQTLEDQLAQEREAAEAARRRSQHFEALLQQHSKGEYAAPAANDPDAASAAACQDAATDDEGDNSSEDSSTTHQRQSRSDSDAISESHIVNQLAGSDTHPPLKLLSKEISLTASTRSTWSPEEGSMFSFDDTDSYWSYLKNVGLFGVLQGEHTGSYFVACSRGSGDATILPIRCDTMESACRALHLYLSTYHPSAYNTERKLRSNSLRGLASSSQKQLLRRMFPRMSSSRIEHATKAQAGWLITRHVCYRQWRKLGRHVKAEVARWDVEVKLSETRNEGDDSASPKAAQAKATSPSS